ncbi:MBL fold metallo-hydrolase, partial [Klebsiella pneumoniae]|uniref:MBL fold metallo-hydrolase n=1 Tax=Klebsiella pneumoniae TaxID=573 RepID=UPI00117AECE8
MFYKIEKISENTYRFDENGRANCYLIVGNEKALLIDGCWGIGDLKQTIREITDKPVIAVATHRHPDHTFGLRQLGDYYVSEKDNTQYNRRLENRLLGMAIVLAEKQKI